MKIFHHHSAFTSLEFTIRGQFVFKIHVQFYIFVTKKGAFFWVALLRSVLITPYNKNWMVLHTPEKANMAKRPLLSSL